MYQEVSGLVLCKVKASDQVRLPRKGKRGDRGGTDDTVANGKIRKSRRERQDRYKGGDNVIAKVRYNSREREDKIGTKGEIL